MKILNTAVLAGAALLCGSSSANAYDLYNEGQCSPGARLDASSPVDVYFLTDSYADYGVVQGLGFADLLLGLAAAVQDLKAVIEEYNDVEGSRLTLRYAGLRTGDDNLGKYPGECDPSDANCDEDSFPTGSIVVGFTTTAGGGAPAWVPLEPGVPCTMLRRYVHFRKETRWTFGPPPNANVDGKSFGGGISFRAVLLHEMGHAVGLGHPADRYAVMDHGTKVWTRGTSDSLRVELLPDDIRGVRALYSDGRATSEVDVSVTNTWFLDAAQRTDNNRATDNRVGKNCGGLEDAREALEEELAIVEAALAINGGGAGRQVLLERRTNLLQDIADATEALETCWYTEREAAQHRSCQVSSRADGWVTDGGFLRLCGVNNPISSRPPVSTSVCSGSEIQLRVTLNNKTLGRRIRVNLEAWFSTDDDLETSGAAADKRSSTIRSAIIEPGSSRIRQARFRVPFVSPGTARNLRVYVRAIPFDATTGARLWTRDVDQWNNSLRVHGALTVTSPCLSSQVGSLP